MRPHSPFLRAETTSEGLQHSQARLDVRGGCTAFCGSFALALRRGIVTRTPLDGLAASEVPKQKNARPIAVPDDAGIVS